MRKPADPHAQAKRHQRSAFRSATRPTRTGSAGEAEVSFCEIKSFTEQKETSASPVLTAPYTPADKKKKAAQKGGFLHPGRTRNQKRAVNSRPHSRGSFRKPVRLLKSIAPTTTSSSVMLRPYIATS